MLVTNIFGSRYIASINDEPAQKWVEGEYYHFLEGVYLFKNNTFLKVENCPKCRSKWANIIFDECEKNKSGFHLF